MYKFLYKWHKWIGIVISLPVIVWALSGLLHPTLRLTKPVLETHKLVQQPVSTEALMLEPDAVLKKYRITYVKNIRLVTMRDKHYYRVSLADGKNEYFDTLSGKQLIDGEQQHAEYLARHYLGDKSIGVSSIELVTAFNEEYAPINRFLPVWRVNFERNDDLRLYVDTESSRNAAAVDNLRAELLWWFGVLHDWSFLEKDNLGRIAIFIIAMLAMFIIGLTGLVLYGLRCQCMKNTVGEQSRNNIAYFHRTIGLLISLSTLMFSFSGGMHVWHKLNPDARHTRHVENLFSTEDLGKGIKQLLNTTTNTDSIQTFSLVKLNNEIYYRIVHANNKRDGMGHTGHKKQKNWPKISYVHSQSGDVLKDANIIHGQQLASQLSGLNIDKIRSIQTVTRFNSEYGFIDRRLPVTQVQYSTDGNPAYYVDPATDRLAAMVDDSRRFEKFTFRMFHKWRFADALGKNGRDGLIAVFILLNVVVIILGVLMFVRKRRSITSR